MRDVAKVAGVTHVTVHNVLNGKGRVSDEMRACVLKVVDELGYRSNLSARTLTTGRSRCIGVLVRDVKSYIASHQLAGAEAAAREAGYQPILSAHQDDAVSAVAALEAMRDRQLDGVVSLSSVAAFNPSVARHLPRLGLPVTFGFHAPTEKQSFATDSVLADQRGVMREVVRHLLKLGRRRIAFLGVNQQSDGLQRLAGARDEMSAQGMTLDDGQIVLSDSWEYHIALDHLRERLDGRALPDAIIAASDQLACGALHYLKERGARVPEDVAVTGFDNAFLTRAMVPELTTVEMPLAQIGRVCVERLIARIENPAAWEPSLTLLPCRLIVRDSCGANLPDA